MDKRMGPSVSGPWGPEPGGPGWRSLSVEVRAEGRQVWASRLQISLQLTQVLAVLAAPRTGLREKVFGAGWETPGRSLPLVLRCSEDFPRRSRNKTREKWCVRKVISVNTQCISSIGTSRLLAPTSQPWQNHLVKTHKPQTFRFCPSVCPPETRARF